MGVEHALKTFAHRVGTYKDMHVSMLSNNTGHSSL